MRDIRIPLSEGWNLISFPYTPVKPGVADVFRRASVSTVLGYQAGEWKTAAKRESGLWAGTLDEVAGGCGYWVHATESEPLAVQLSDAARVKIVNGWNLIGVIGDQEQDADAYLTLLDWRVANTLRRPAANVADDGEWTEVRKGEHGTLQPARGYWVWSTGGPVTMQRSGSGSRQPALA